MRQLCFMFGKVEVMPWHVQIIVFGSRDGDKKNRDIPWHVPIISYDFLID